MQVSEFLRLNLLGWEFTLDKKSLWVYTHNERVIF